MTLNFISNSKINDSQQLVYKMFLQAAKCFSAQPPKGKAISPPATNYSNLLAVRTYSQEELFSFLCWVTLLARKLFHEDRWRDCFLLLGTWCLKEWLTPEPQAWRYCSVMSTRMGNLGRKKSKLFLPKCILSHCQGDSLKELTKQRYRCRALDGSLLPLQVYTKQITNVIISVLPVPD